jgi:hypothetical protein
MSENTNGPRKLSLFQRSLRYGANFREEPPNATVYQREQEDFKVKYTETIEKLANRYNILLNDKIRDIKLYCIQEFKKLDSNKSNMIKGTSILKLDQVVKIRLTLLNEWLKDMQFIWSFFTASKTGFILEDSIHIDLTNKINRELLQKTLDDIDREIGNLLIMKYEFPDKSHGGRRATQRKRTPRRRKVDETRKKRY